MEDVLALERDINNLQWPGFKFGHRGRGTVHLASTKDHNKTACGFYSIATDPRYVYAAEFMSNPCGRCKMVHDQEEARRDAH